MFDYNTIVLPINIYHNNTYDTNSDYSTYNVINDSIFDRAEELATKYYGNNNSKSEIFIRGYIEACCDSHNLYDKPVKSNITESEKVLKFSRKEAEEAFNS